MVGVADKTNNEAHITCKMKDNGIVQCNGDIDLPTIVQEVSDLGEKFRKMEQMLLSRDTAMTASMQDLFSTLKTLSHNQSMLESKLDDALRNQMNTDVLVNSINERLNKLSSSVGTITRTMHLSETSNNLNNIAHSTSLENGGEQLASRPPTVRRGPGRPRKDGTVNRSNDSSNHNVQQVKVTLPTGGVQMAKSRRYFTDPSMDSDYSPTVKDETSSQNKQLINSTTGSNNGTSTPTVKRKRGRPPKKRTVETVIINENHINEETGGEENKFKDSTPSNNETNDNNNNNNNNSDINSSTPTLPRVMSAADLAGTGAPSTVNSPSPTRSPSNSSLPSHAVPSTVATVDSANYPDNNFNNKIPTESGIITTRIITPLARKKLLGTNNENDNIVVEVSSTNDDGNTDVSSSLSRQQRELEKRRDSREKMLVNMKYNDREKAKSFMESNKKLLKAMRDEERRKRMTALIYDTQSPYPARSINRMPNQLPASSETKFTDDHVPKIEESNQLTKKIGISSMLNTEDTISNIVPQNESIGPLKRARSNDLDEEEEEFSEDLDDDSQNGRPLRRRRNSTQSTNISDENRGPSIEVNDGSIYEQSESNFESVTDSRVEAKNESQVSLLLASPIELLCRDGFFYRRNMPNVPITTGSYLEFKFKPKQDELLLLRKNQKDYFDKTKQNRMNAHFFKPEIELETDVAVEILSKTTLTEKYVNSLEYFLMEFRWENKLVGLGLKLRESKRTWQRRKALFALFEFWRDQSREKRNFADFTILHAVKEMENYRIFINRSVSWFYNHITLLKMILYDLCDNVDTQWREWMFHKDQNIPLLGVNGVNEDNINEAIDNVLTLDFLDDGSENNQIKSSKVIPPTSHESAV